MFRQVGIGAAAVLSIGLLAAGCSDDGDTIVIGGSGDLNNNDSVSLTSVASNNLAPDGGGLSQNGANVSEFTVTFNCDCCSSDGTFAGDNSAIVLFEVSDGTDFRIFASHFDGSTLSPPAELFGEDRDDDMGVNLQAFVCIPLNTSAYQSGTTNTTGVTETQANDGNWLILGACSTQFVDPVLRVSTTATPPTSGSAVAGNLTTTNARGKRWALYSWRFVKNNRDVPQADLTFNSITESFRYGFEQTGDIVNTSFQGGGAARGNVPVNTAAAGLAVPPNHVTSFGFVSDTLCGQATFGGNALPFSADGNTGTVGTYNHPDTAGAGTVVGTSQETAFSFAIPTITALQTGSAVGNINNGMDPFGTGNAPGVANSSASFRGYRTPSYTVGEATTFITAVWTQICNSFSGGGTFTAGIGGSHAGGHEIQARSRGFDMANFAWEANEAEIVEPASRNSNTGNLRAGTAPFPTFHVYNNFLYFKYADASLITDNAGTNNNLLSLNAMTGVGNVNWFQNEVGGHEGGAIIRTGVGAGFDHGFWEEIIAVVRVTDDTDGTSTIGTPVDLSSDSNTNGGTAGTHTLTNVTVNTNGIDTYPADRELANFNRTQSIIGPDEGNVEISLFYVMSDGSNTTGNVNIDTELCVVVHDTNGALISGTNPNRISGTSIADHHEGHLAALDGNGGGTGLTLLEDPIVPNGGANGTNGTGAAVAGTAINGWRAANIYSSGNAPRYFQMCLGRTGQYAAIAYLKDSGLSSGTNAAGSFHQGLFAVVYQPFRQVAGTTGTGTAANVEARTTTPIEVQNTLAINTPNGRADANGVPAAVTDAESFRNWDSQPVNSYAWQGKLGYRCGMQSNANALSLFYEQSDATGDRVFGRQLVVTVGATGTPTATFTATAAELDASDAIVSHASFTTNDGSAGNATRNGNTTAPFIDTTANLTGGGFFSCDSGVDVGGATGQVFAVYRKIVDNTSADGDLADAEVRAVVFDGTSFGTAVAIDTQTNENAPVIAAAGDNTEANPQQSRNSNVSNSTAAGTPVALTCVPNNSDIENTPNYPNANSTVDIGISATDREASQTSTGGTNTTTTDPSKRLALYLRKWPGVVTGTTASDVASRIQPTTTGGVQPIQMDHDAGTNDDVSSIVVVQNGSSVGYLFQAENQIWLQATTDFSTLAFLNGNLSNPALVTNDNSADIVNPAWRYFQCMDSNGDTTSGILLYAKNDREGDIRLHARSGAATN